MSVLPSFWKTRSTLGSVRDWLEQILAETSKLARLREMRINASAQWALDYAVAMAYIRLGNAVKELDAQYPNGLVLRYAPSVLPDERAIWRHFVQLRDKFAHARVIRFDLLWMCVDNDIPRFKALWSWS
jgi:uncharacterized protein with HEPN domain